MTGSEKMHRPDRAAMTRKRAQAARVEEGDGHPMMANFTDREVACG